MLPLYLTVRESHCQTDKSDDNDMSSLLTAQVVAAVAIVASWRFLVPATQDSRRAAGRLGEEEEKPQTVIETDVRVTPQIHVNNAIIEEEDEAEDAKVDSGQAFGRKLIIYDD